MEHFDQFQEYKPSQFSARYQRANCLQRLFCTYMLDTMRIVQEKEEQMLAEKPAGLVSGTFSLDTENVVDLNEKPRAEVVADQTSQPRTMTYIENQKFALLTQQGVEKAVSEGRKPDYNDILWKALIAVYKGDIIFLIVVTFLSETFSILTNYQIKNIIAFLNDEEAELQEGFVLVAIFIAGMLASQLLRNNYVVKGTQVTLQMRRTLVTALFDKVTKLSMKGMT